MTNLYTASGVNLDEAEKLNMSISRLNHNSGAFAGEVIFNGLKILNCCDGIGSKIIPLYEHKLYSTIAIDLIAANLNDMATKNAKAIAFSDYISVNKLDSGAVSKIIIELRNELLKYDCELLGGETSEIPHLVKDGKIDICGFAIGVSQNLHQTAVSKGDIVIGLESSGIHANGFTLIRQLYSEKKITSDEFMSCLAPAFVYYNEIRNLWENNLIKSAANITGGGIKSNLFRIIPKSMRVDFDYEAIPRQKIFEKLKVICGQEAWNVFNCGVGFCVVAEPKNAYEIFTICKKYEPFILGRVV